MRSGYNMGNIYSPDPWTIGARGTIRHCPVSRRMLKGYVDCHLSIVAPRALTAAWQMDSGLRE